MVKARLGSRVGAAFPGWREQREEQYLHSPRWNAYT